LLGTPKAARSSRRVIGERFHLFHFVETAITKRRPHFSTVQIRSERLPTTAIEKTAYCGIAFLDTDAYPPRFRERIVVRQHSRGALNVDRYATRRPTYLAKGEVDLLNGNDAWFMPRGAEDRAGRLLYVLDGYRSVSLLAGVPA